MFYTNIFSAELSYSRMHYFNYSKYKTREDVMNNLILAFKYYGGVTECVLTDNMSSIVNTNENKFCNEFKTFSKDIGINSKKCKVRHPFTKGKVEVRNKFMKWLIPYNYEFETEEDISKIIRKINIEVNNRVNDTTNMKPILLYQKEKEYLKPLPTNQILEHYMNLNVSVKVQNTMLIKYKGNDGSMLCPYLLGVLVEIILTFVFMLAVLGVLSKPENKRITGIIIGLSLGLVHLLGLALTGTSVNPARSIGPAIIEAFSGKTQALKELWIFIIGPCFGGCLALITHKCLTKSNK